MSVVVKVPLSLAPFAAGPASVRFLDATFSTLDTAAVAPTAQAPRSNDWTLEFAAPDGTVYLEAVDATGTTIRTVTLATPTPAGLTDAQAALLAHIGTGVDALVAAPPAGLTTDQATLLTRVGNEVAVLAGGDGRVQVDHNYGGTDALRVTDAQDAGVDQVAIRAYVAGDYAGGGRVLRGATHTHADGRWAGPLWLDPGIYVLEFEASNFALLTQEVTVGA